jgi:site-specific recombinase XerD
LNNLSILASLSKEQLLELISASASVPKSSPKSIFIDDGLSIYKMKQSRFWWLRLRLNSQYIKKSTNEEDPLRARDKAILMRSYLMGQSDAGVLISSPALITVAEVVSLAVPHILRTVKSGTVSRYIAILEKKISPILGHLPVQNIDSKEIYDLFFSLKLQSKTQVTIHKTSFSHLFKFAMMNRYIAKIPDMPDYACSDVVDTRDPFSSSDLSLFYRFFSSFSAASIKGTTLELRSFLRPYFNFLLTTGVRPGVEPLSLKWSDISKQTTKHGVCFVATIKKGKTSKKGPRVVILSKSAMIAMTQALLLNHSIETSRMDFSKFIDDYSSEYIFRPMSSQKRSPVFERIFRHFIDHVSEFVELSSHYVLYCCRHTYINDRINEGVDLSLIARNCGNSVSVIEKYYEKRITIMNAHKLVDLQELDENAKKLFGSVLLSHKDFDSLVEQSMSEALNDQVNG